MPNQIRKAVLGILAAATTVTLLSACGGGGEGVAAPTPGASGTPGTPVIPAAPGTPGTPGTPPGGDGSGTLRIALTDAPACGYDHVYITVDRVRVHASSSAEDSDGGWSEVVVNPAQRIDLLDLTNGVLAELGQTPLPAGQYSQVRLVLRSNGTGTPANAVVPTGGSEIPLDTPSATQSGLKLVHGFTVQPNTLVDLVLDFDACKSIVKRGNSGRYNLKPVDQRHPQDADGDRGLRADGAGGRNGQRAKERRGAQGDPAECERTVRPGSAGSDEGTV